VLLEEEVDDGGVLGVDEREHGDLHMQTRGLAAPIGPGCRGSWPRAPTPTLWRRNRPTSTR
jgi:hypothetical protein